MEMTDRKCKRKIPDVDKDRKKSRIGRIAVVLALFLILSAAVFYFAVFSGTGEKHYPHKTVIQKQCVQERKSEKQEKNETVGRESETGKISE